MNEQQVEPRQRKPWTAGEDSCLYQEVRRVGIYSGTSNDWNAVAASLPRRTNKDCRKRWLKICKSVNKGLWSGEEDERLLEAIGKHGQKWTEVSRIVQTRHADQCAKRWQTVLCQNGEEAQAWTDQDDESLLQAIDLYGQQWKLIAEQYFPGRSAAVVRSRYTSLTDSSRPRAADDESTSPRSKASPGIDPSFEMHGEIDFSLDSMDMMPAFTPEDLSSHALVSNDFSIGAMQQDSTGAFVHDCQPFLPLAPSQTPISTMSTVVDPTSDVPSYESNPTTLTLTNVRPNTLSDVLGILMRDKVKVSVAINGS